MKTQRFVLPAELTIYAVGELHAALLAWSQAPMDSGLLDAHHVSDVDGAGIQLLGAVSQQFAARQQRLLILSATPVLRQACDALGCSNWFEWTDSEGGL